MSMVIREKPEGDEEKKKKVKDEKKRKIRAAIKGDDSDEDRADGEWEVVKNGVAVPAVNIYRNFLLRKRKLISCLIDETR